MICKYGLAIALVRIVYYLNHCVSGQKKGFNSNFIECGGAMRLQRKIMMVETTHAFVKLKRIKVAMSAGGIKSVIFFINKSSLRGL